jgi:probable phosphoglycerate mutase
VDVELAKEGRRQAELLGKRMERYRIDALYSSNLIRAVQTARILNKYFNQEHVIREDIREISFGFLEGKSDEEIDLEFSDFRREQMLLKEDIPYPGGECGKQVFDRAVNTMEEIIKTDKQNVAVVTHGGVIRALLAGLLGLDMSKKLLFGASLENTSITHLVYSKAADRFLLQRFNDYAHLEEEEELLRRTL